MSNGFRDVLFWTALKQYLADLLKPLGFRDVLFWTALKPMLDNLKVSAKLYSVPKKDD